MSFKDYKQYWEEKILSSDNYDWRKHLILNIPEFISFALKWLVLGFLLKIVISAVIATGIVVALDTAPGIESDINSYLLENKNSL